MKNFEIDRHRLSHLSLTQIYLALYFTTMRDTQWSEPLPTNEPVKREVKVENSSVVHVTGAALRRPCTETSKWTVDVLAQRALQTFLTKAHAFTKLSPWKPSVESHGSSLSSSPKDDFSLSPLVWKHKRYLNSISSFIAKKKCGNNNTNWVSKPMAKILCGWLCHVLAIAIFVQDKSSAVESPTT